MFHKHQFDAICQTTTKPISLKEIQDTNLEIAACVAERMLYGVTTVLLKCKKCNKMVKAEMLGLESMELKE